jgi:hypothetical protein
VSYEHLDAAAELEGLAPGPKLVLVALAKTACKTCGLGWPGVKWIARKTGMKETSIRAALEVLRSRDLIQIHGYATGGRGRSTEYVVLPGLFELSTAPCGECRANMQTPRVAKGIAEKASATRRVSPKPIAPDPQNPSRGEPQSVRESNQSHADLAETPGSGAAAPPSSEPPPPTSGAEAYAQVSAMVDGVAAAMRLKSPSQGNSGAQGGLTERTSAVPRKENVI